MQTNASLSTRQISAIQYLSENDSIDNRTYRFLFSVSNKTAHQELRALVSKKILQRWCGGRATSYRLKPKEATSSADVDEVTRRVTDIFIPRLQKLSEERSRLSSLLEEKKIELEKNQADLRRKIEDAARASRLLAEQTTLKEELEVKIHALERGAGHDDGDAMRRIESAVPPNVFKMPNSFGKGQVQFDPRLLAEAKVLAMIVDSKAEHARHMAKRETNPIRVYSLVDQAREFEVISSFIRTIINRK